MAVHLKKRACEEFSQVTVQKVPQIKRLRLTKKTKDVKNETLKNKILELNNLTDHQVMIDSLMEFFKFIKNNPTNISPTILSLVALFQKQKNVIVKTKVIQIIGKLCQTIGYNPLSAVKSLYKLLNTEESNQVVAQLWSTILSCLKIIPNETVLITSAVQSARHTLLNNSNSQVKRQCLLFIAYLSNADMLSVDSSKIPTVLCKSQTLIGQFFNDSQPRIRSTALEAMIILHEKGQKLERSTYEAACHSLLDDYEPVRLLAVKLVWIISQLYPDSQVNISNCGENLRLVDDAFAYICNMINDSSIKVRATAMKLLGSMHNITRAFLFQTLDKKIMSDLKRKKSLNEKAKECYVEEFASGAKWSADAPREVDLDTAQLMSSGACGAFVHGLEDEMMEVRSAAVDSLTELACECKESKFPQSALDSLVDCLNDEIESVRLNAVHSLHKVMDNVTLLEDQLENVLSAMEDASVDIRIGIHKLLSKCTLMSKLCVHNTSLNLQKNLLKYPNDKRSIWEAYKFIGKHHSQLVYLLVPNLLSLHPYFDTPEPKMDDPGYIGQLILVFNAAEICQKMTQMFPGYVIRHYQYLRDSLPDLVPQNIKLTTYANNDNVCLMSPTRNTESKSDPKQFLTRALERNKNLQIHDPNVQKTLLQCTINDLKHVASIAPSLSSMALCSAKYFEAQLLLSQVANSRAWSGSVLSAVQHLAYAKPLAGKVTLISQELENLFLGLSVLEVGSLKQMRLKAVAVEFLSDIQQGKGDVTLNELTSSDYCQAFFKVIKETQEFLRIHNLPADNFCKTLFNEVLKLDPTKKQSLVAKLLQPLLLHYNVSVLPLQSKVRGLAGILTLPKVHADKPVTFKAGLAITLDVEGNIENATNPLHEIVLQVEYPDGTNQIVDLQPSNIKKIKPHVHHISTALIISHVQWSDMSKIKVSFCKVCKNLLPNFSGNIYEKTKYLPLSKPTEISLQPKGLY